jgi:hypothetical protein
MTGDSVGCSSCSGLHLEHRCDGDLLFVATRARWHEGLPDARRRERDVFDHIERFCDAIRRRSAVGHVSSAEFESKFGTALVAIHQTDSGLFADC